MSRVALYEKAPVGRVLFAIPLVCHHDGLPARAGQLMCRIHGDAWSSRAAINSDVEIVAPKIRLSAPA